MSNDFITEDTLVQWIKSINGILHTRKESNIYKVDLSKCPERTVVCLTGYDKIIKQFFNTIINFFQYPIILITIETDVFQLLPQYLDHHLLHHWITWNKPPINHSKLSAIPIGLNYDRHIHAITNFNQIKLNKEPIKNSKMMLVNLSPDTNPIRQSLIEKTKTDWKDFAEYKLYEGYDKIYYQPSIVDGQIRIMTTKTEYYQLISQYKFILSPPGAGEDCHRTWEALYVDVIPIVLESSISELYENLPIVSVKNWNDISEEFLEKEYDRIENLKKNGGFKIEKAYLEYWKNKILKIIVE
jgi:hypothetical protein